MDSDDYWRATQVSGQLAMTGDDWTSEQDKRRQARAEAALRKASLNAAKHMRAAAGALNEHLLAALDAGHPDRMGQADGRRRLIGDLLELAGHFESVYGGKG